MSKIAGHGGLFYNTYDINKCEYAALMQKVYFPLPEIKDGKCNGYRNRYTKGLSNICKQCEHCVEVV